VAVEFADAEDEAGFAAAEGFGSGFGAGFFFLLACVAEALIESALFGSDCADADVAQAITVTKAKAAVHIFLGDKYTDMPPTITTVYLRRGTFVASPISDIQSHASLLGYAISDNSCVSKQLVALWRAEHRAFI